MIIDRPRTRLKVLKPWAVHRGEAVHRSDENSPSKAQNVGGPSCPNFTARFAFVRRSAASGPPGQTRELELVIRAKETTESAQVCWGVLERTQFASPGGGRSTRRHCAML